MSTMISLQTILWSALAAAAGIGLPVLVLLVWKFKFCRGAKLFPAVVGAATFVVFAQVLEGVPKAIFFGGSTVVSQYVLTHAWAYTLIGCLLAGVFEEVGRYLAFRFLLKRYTNRRDAVTYGIGHGGIEAILVLGLTAINNIAIAQLVNSGSFETITNGLTGVQLDQVQAQIAAVASFGAANLLLGLAERAIAMTLHISLSVVVFRAVRQRKAGYLGLAVALHALFDVPAALFQCGVLHSTWLVEALLLVLCLGCAAYAKKQYCALQEPEQQALSDREER